MKTSNTTNFAGNIEHRLANSPNSPNRLLKAFLCDLLSQVKRPRGRHTALCCAIRPCTIAIALAIFSAASIQAQMVEADGDVFPFPNPNPTTNWTVDDVLIVGLSGTGQLDISGGGIVSSAVGSVGNDVGSQGRVTVIGENSRWTIADLLEVGWRGNGELRVEDAGVVESDGGYIGVTTDSEALVVVHGSNSQWTNSSFLDIGGPSGSGELRVEAGGKVSSWNGGLGMNGGSGRALVSGADSEWTMNAQLSVGTSGTGTLQITDGGNVSNTFGYIGRLNNGTGDVLVAGSGSTWTNANDLILGGSNLTTETTGIGSLTIEQGGEVTVGGSSRIWGGSSVDIEVLSSHTTGSGGTHALSIDSDLTNDGLIRLTAAPTTSAGTYAPVSVGGTWTGTGTLQTIGGTWDAGEREFVISSSLMGSSGVSTDINLATNQRLQVGGQLQVAFDSQGEATGGGSTIAFTATLNTIPTIEGEQVLSAWDFTTDLVSGTNVQLSLEVGTGWDPALFIAWHSVDGINWTLFTTDIFYDGTSASFFVDGFSSYAVTVPEPSTALLMLLAGGAWMLRRRCRNA